MKILSTLISLFVVLTISSTASAQWVQEEDGVYGKIWSGVLMGQKGFATDGTLFDVEEFSILSSHVYAEYGVSENFTLVGSAQPLAFASMGNDPDSAKTEAYFGPVMGGVRAAILKGSVPVAIELRGGGASAGGEVDLAPDGADYKFVPVRMGMLAEFDLQVGVSFWQMWAQARWGLGAHSAAEIGSYMNGQMQVGWSHSSGVVLDVHSHMRWPMEELEVTEVSGGGRTAYVGLGFGASWWFSEYLAVTAGLDGAITAKSNAGAAAITLGFEARN